MIRLVAASLVLYGHAPAFAATGGQWTDAVKWLTGLDYSGSVAVHVFFVISGFLVTASAASRSAISYFRARTARILPGLFAFTIAVTLFGLLVTSLPRMEYLTSPATWHFVWSNGTLISTYATDLPGVFEASRFGPSVNGTIWTLWVELRLYLLVGMGAVLGVWINRWAGNAAILSLVAWGFIDPSTFPLVGINAANLVPALYFALGSLAYLNRDAIPLRADGAVLAVMLVFIARPTPSLDYVLAGAVTYLTLYLAFLRKVPLPQWVQDYSYGIYLYGWPVQQALAIAFPQSGAWQLLAVSVPVAWGLGALSWFAVERPAMRLNRSLDRDGEARRKEQERTGC